MIIEVDCYEMNTHLSMKKSDGERLDGLQSVEARRATPTGGEKLWAVAHSRRPRLVFVPVKRPDASSHAASQC